MAEERIPHLSKKARAELGKQARANASRASQGVYEPASDRPDPVDLLERQAKTRVPELVPIRYGRMLVSPFTFYRGAALIMASDLATGARSGITTQICGDAHLSNFGLFGSPERALVFDVNDFDETLPGPWEWDVKRLAASVVVAARDRSFTAKQSAAAALAVGAGYRQEMRRLAGLRNLDVWYSQMDVGQLLADFESETATRSKDERTMASRVLKTANKARTKDSLQALAKLTTVVDGRRQIISDPPIVVPAIDLFADRGSREALIDEMHSLIRRYRKSLQPDRRHLLEQFDMVDVARKVVGVGSVGTRAWIVLFTGVDGDDPLFLQAKQAEASVLEEFVGDSTHRNHGQRVVAGQHLMQAASDIFLGWERIEGDDGIKRDFYIRQLRDWKGSFETEGMIPAGLVRYSQVCAMALARAHARSGDRVAIASYLGAGDTFDRAIAEFADTYADQNERDYETFQKAVADGRITAQTGV